MIGNLKTKIINRLKNELRNVNAINRNAEIATSCQIKGATISAACVIGENSIVKYTNLNGTINVGADNRIEETKISGSFSSGTNCKLHGVSIQGNVIMGNYSSLWGPNLDIVTDKEKVVIGNFCSIARNVTVQAFNHNHKKLTSYFIGKNIFAEKWENEHVSKGDIIIGNDVWIGAHCVILGGVIINNGAVIAANSVVTREVPAFSIVGGIPAKVIGYRFEKDTINEIQKMKWWDWSIDKIKQNRLLFVDEVNVELLKEIANE